MTNVNMEQRTRRRYTVADLKELQAKGMGTRDLADLIGTSRDAVKRLLKHPDWHRVDSISFNWFTSLQGDIDEFIEALKTGEVHPRPR